MTEDFYLGIEGELIKKGNGLPVKIGFIGCGSHSFRNIFSALQYIPVELVAVCDQNKAKAEAYKAKFGAHSAYTSYKEMLEKEKLEAVIVVVGYAEDGTPLYFEIVKELLRRNIPVWFEKPPARNSEEVKEYIELEQKGTGFAQVGFKKMFMPSIKKVQEIVNKKEFGKINSYFMRYPVDLPYDTRDITSASGRRFIDDFVHVASSLIAVLGRPDYLYYKRNDRGSAIATLIHKQQDIIGTIHLCPGASEMCPLEQFEITGENANVILDNNINIRYYPPSQRLPYGTTTSFLPNNPNGGQIFSPEFSLGQLYNKGSFLLGYYHELSYFIDCVSKKKKPQIAGLSDALKVMQLYDAFSGKEGTLINIDETQRLEKTRDNQNEFKKVSCPNCHVDMVLKDGWNYSCKTCGKMIAASSL